MKWSDGRRKTLDERRLTAHKTRLKGSKGNELMIWAMKGKEEKKTTGAFYGCWAKKERQQQKGERRAGRGKGK